MKSAISAQRTPEDRIQRKRAKCVKKFLYYFPRGYKDPKYISWEREYKWNAHLMWQGKLNKTEFAELISRGEYLEIAKRATAIESKTNLLFSFEKMALRDAVKTIDSAKLFSEGLFNYIYGGGPMRERFLFFRDTLQALPVKQTRVLTWPLQTVFGFIADPEHHIYLKPTVTRTAAAKYHFDFHYQSRPNWETFESLLSFGAAIREDTAKWKPRDMIDLQSFIWVLGSDEYPD